MPELTREERIAKALELSQSEEILQDETPKTLTKEERIARALKLSQEEDKKKSQSQSGSSTEESSSGTSETKKEQSSGTTKPLSLEEKKALARKQKSSNINWDVDKETEQAFKGVATKEEKKAQAKQEAISVGETFMPNIEEKSKAKEIQSQAKEIKPELDTQRKLKAIPQEDLKAIFEGDNELTMFDGGQRLAEKYNLTEEELEKAQKKYLNDKVTEFKRKDLESSLDLITKYAPAPKDFKDITAYTQNIELLNKAKEMSFEKNKNLSFSLMDLDDNQRKVVDEYSSVMDRLNSYKEKSFVQKQGEDGSMVINPKEVAQFEKDLKESQRLSKEVDKIRGNNNRLFDELSNVINKDTDKQVTQESFTSKYNNDYMKLKGALEDATYKLNYLEKEARGIRDTSREKGISLTAKQNEALSNLDRERNLAKAEVLALSNALFLNEDITKKVARYDKNDSYYQMPFKKTERLLEVLSDVKQGFNETILGEFNMTSTSEKNQARILNEKLKSVGINLKDADKELAYTYPEKFGGVLGTSTVLGANIAATTFLTGGIGTIVKGAGVLPKVFELYDKSKKFKAIADVIISGVNFELASDQTSFAMGSAEEAAQLAFNKVFGKLKPLNPIVNFFTKSLIGATGVTVEEYAGDLFHEFTKTGISQETFDNTFGKTKEEGLEKWSLTFTMGMMSMGKHAKVLMVGSYETAKAINPNSETVKQMESVMSEMGIDPDDVIASLKAEAETKSDRVYPDGKGGQLRASNMTVEQEIVLREKLNYKPLTEDELTLKRTVQETEELAPSDSPYVTKKEMDDDLKLLKGEDEGSVPETYVGESVKTDEGIVTTVTEKVEEGTQLRVPVEQLVVEEAKPISETFDRAKAGVIDVWQDAETNELFVINGTKRVATALEDGTSSVDVNFVKANSLQEAYKIGELKNKLEDTDKTIDAVELVKANPTLKDNLDLSKPKELELFGLSSLNESLTEELKSNPNQVGVLSIIGNSVPIQNQDSVYEVVKRIGLTAEQTSVLVKMPEVKNATKTFVDNKQKALSSIEETTKALDKYEQENEPEFIDLQKLFNLDKGYTFDSGAAIEGLQKLARKGNKMGNVKKPSSLKFLPKKITLKHLVRNSKDKKSILKEGFNFNKLDNDSNVPGAYFSSEDWSTVGRFGREQQNALFVDIENEGLVYFDTAEEFEAFLEENGINSNKGLSFEEIKPLLDLGIKGILLKEDVVSRQRNELIVIDGSIIKEISENQKDINNLPSSFPSTKSVAQEYHKVKKDGTNPALVEAVESIFTDDKSYQDNKKTKEADVQLKAKVELKTALTKTGQSNIDSLSEDAAQLGLEPETLYDRILSTSPTVKALTERYAKGVSNGLYSVKDATNRLNTEIKENIGKIKEELNMNATKKDVAQLESALTSNKKNSSEILRDIASKIDKAVDNIGKNSYATIFGVEPLIAKAFLKALSATLKSSATFIDGFNKAIVKFKNSDILKGKTAQEVNDIIQNLTNAVTDLKQKADLKNPLTKLQQSKIKQSIEARIKYLYKNSMTSLPTQKSIEKLAEKSGIIDAKTFAENVYKRLQKTEASREKRMEKFEGSVSDFITKGGGNIKSLFNQLSDLILKDKQQAVTLKNTILNALVKANTKGLKFSQQQLQQITSVFEKANLSNISGIYDLTIKIDQIVNKAVDITLNSKISEMQRMLKRSSKNLKQIKQKEYIRELINLNGSQITEQGLKNDLISLLEDVKEYLSGKDNLNYNQAKLDEFNKSIEDYNIAKEEALIEKMFELFKRDNPNTTITLDEYKQFIYPTEKQLLEEKEAKKELDEEAREKRKEEKRKKLETLTVFNIQSILDFQLNTSLSPLNIQNISKLKDTLKFLVDNNHLKDLEDRQLKEIIKVANELEIFNSSSQLGNLTAELTGIKKAIENQPKMMSKLRTFSGRLKNALFSPDGDPIFGKGNELVGFHRLIERMFVGQEADTIGAIMFKSLFNGVNEAKTEFTKYAKKLKKLAQFELRNIDNYNLGVKAYLLSSPKDISDIEAQVLFERKKEKIKLDIDRLIQKSQVTSGVTYSTQKAAKQRAELYQEALNDISKYDTYQELLDAYDNGDLLNKEQKAVYDLTRGEYEKIKPLLIDSNVAYGDKEFLEENNYTSISYLRMDTGKSEKNILDPNFNNTSGIIDAQSGTVLARVQNPLNVKEVLDFDFYNVSKRRVFESYIDVQTRGARLELSSFINSKQFQEVFANNDDLYNIFKERVSRYANSILANQRTSLNINKRHIRFVRDLISNVKLAYLARTGQVLKQLAILVHSASRLGIDFFNGLGVFLGNVGTVEGRENLTELLSGSDTSNRANLGDEQFSQMVSKLSTYDLTDNRFYQGIQKWLLNPINQGLNIGSLILTHPDLFSNTVTYIGAMIKEQKKQIKKGDTSKLKLGMFPDIYTLKENKDLENTYKADRIAGFINNESDVAKQGGMFTDQGMVAQLFYQFKSMAVNAAVGAQNAILDLTDPTATRKDKEIAILNLMGYVGSVVAFQASKELLKDLWDDNLKEGAKKLTGRKLENPEDKRKSFVDNWNNTTYLSEYAYRIMLRSAVDVLAGGVSPSGVSDFMGTTVLDPAGKTLYKTAFNREYSGENVFFGNWKELGGGFKTLLDVAEASTDIVSPYVYDAEEKRKVSTDYAIAKSMFEAGYNRPLETTADILYFLSIRYGKGVPSEFLGTIKKVIKNNYKVKDGNFERLNPMQKAKEDK
jgi:hypothetical protein